MNALLILWMVFFLVMAGIGYGIFLVIAGKKHDEFEDKPTDKN